MLRHNQACYGINGTDVATILWISPVKKNPDWRLDVSYLNNQQIQIEINNDRLVGGLEHEFSFLFHIWDVIRPIDFHIFQDG